MLNQPYSSIILVHGFRGAPVGLSKVKSALTDLGYTNIHVPAIPPFTDSNRPNTLSSYTPATYADFLKAYSQQHQLDQPVLVGHSMGSIIVAATLQQYPHLFHQKSVLLSPISVRTAPPFRLIAPLSGLLPNRLIDYITTKFLIVDKDKWKQAISLTHQCGNFPPSKLSLLKAANFSTKYSVADFPSDHHFLFLAGEKDRLIPKRHTEQLAHDFHAQTIFLKNTGHIHNYEQPHETALAIHDFLAS